MPCDMYLLSYRVEMDLSQEERKLLFYANLLKRGKVDGEPTQPSAHVGSSDRPFKKGDRDFMVEQFEAMFPAYESNHR